MASKKKQYQKTVKAAGSLPTQGANSLAPINVNQYKTPPTTIKTLQKNYGLDYSRGYAARQAEAAAQGKRTGLQNQQRQVDMGVRNAQKTMDRDYFQKGLQESQGQVNSGLNSGLAAEGNLRLGMQRQADLSKVMTDAAGEKNRIAQELTDVEIQRKQQEEQIYNERLNQAFNQIMQRDQFNQNQNQMLLNGALQQRDQNINQYQFGQQLQWDQYQFNHLSASQQADLDWQRYQFGNLSATDRANMDWQRYQFNNLSASDQAQNQLGYAKLQEEKRQFNSEQDWREYTYKHMSATEKAQLEQDKKQFGEEMAWRNYELSKSSETDMAVANAQYGGDYKGGPVMGYNNMHKMAEAPKSKTYPAYQRHMRQAATIMNIPKEWVPLLDELFGRESSWNWKASNPRSSARGYAQFLDQTVRTYEKKNPGLHYDSDPVAQLMMGIQYIKDRYKTPKKALEFWDRNNWY